jgi:hypothetical protein
MQFGLTVGAHHEQIGTKSRCLRQQEMTHILTTGRQALYFNPRAVTHQVACDIRPRLLSVTSSLVLIINDQDLYRFCPSKQWQGIRKGPNRLACRVPSDEDAAHPRCRGAWRKKNDRSA